MYRLNRNTLISLLLVSLLTGISSCSEEIDLYTPYKTVPVVYGLLNPDSVQQYIRVGQSFYYEGDEAVLGQAKLTRLDEEFELYITCSDTAGNFSITYFEPFYGVYRDSGLFNQEELMLYSAEMPLEYNAQYKLYLELKESGTIVYGELRSFQQPFRVIDPLDVDFRTINLFTDEDYYLRFETVMPRAVYQATLYFNYLEFTPDYQIRKTMPFELDLTYGEDRDQVLVGQRFSGEFFLRELSRRLEAKEDLKRIPLSMSFHLTAGGEETYYLLRSLNQQFGFSARSVSNLDNGIGLFSTMSHRIIDSLPLSEYTIDSLAHSQYTSHLGFVSYSNQKP